MTRLTKFLLLPSKNTPLKYLLTELSLYVLCNIKFYHNYRRFYKRNYGSK